jgi:hypothetical protein
MDVPASPRLQSFFRAIVSRRWWFVALYAAVLPLGVLLALGVPTDTSVERLVVAGDADFLENEAYQEIFPERAHVVLLAEAPDPFAPAVQESVAGLVRRLRGIPGVTAFSALDLHAQSPAAAASRGPDAFRRFATGSDLFRRQGLAGEDFLGVVVELDAPDPAARDAALAAIEAAVAPFERDGAPIARVRRVGGPYVDAYLEQETGRASLTYFPFFGLFLVLIILALYRSWRTLAAFLITLAVCVAAGVGLAGLFGFSFTIVSSLVPLTILITATSALVYIQSRFADNPGDHPVDEHQVFALANKFTATTASIAAAAIGFAALAVSRIRPVREMGLWVAGALVLTWIVVFTLFPALQKLLATPVRGGRRVSRMGASRALEALPDLTWRARWVIIPVSVLLMLLGTLALTGVAGNIPPMRLETDALAYIDRSLPLYQDMRRFEESISGLSAVQVWLTAPGGEALRPDLLRGYETFSRRLESDPRVGSVSGPTTLLRWMSYVTRGSDRLPDTAESWAGLADRLDTLLLENPEARGFVDVGSLSHVRLQVVYRGEGFQDVAGLKGFLEDHWKAAVALEPGLSDCRLRVAGQGLLQARIAEHLVPTLTESFAITAALIFVAFLVVFRSASARLLAMIPSVFAILVMFLVMRLTGISLNVATILIASTVLGASENDQIHFFYHFQEARRSGSVGRAMHHALRIAGRGILFATLINAGGFLALAMSRLPPMRQFGICTSSAFVLSMLASLVALPAALWVFLGQRPGHDGQPAGAEGPVIPPPGRITR